MSNTNNEEYNSNTSSPPSVSQTLSPYSSTQLPIISRNIILTSTETSNNNSIINSNNNYYDNDRELQETIEDKSFFSSEMQSRKKFKTSIPSKDYISWNNNNNNNNNWSTLSGHIIQENKRYVSLMPLIWGSNRDFIIMLARDSFSGTLVITRKYKYHFNSNNSYSSFNNEGNIKNSFIPFSQEWRQRMYTLLRLHHPHIHSILDILINEKQHEILLVYPYKDGMQPLAAVFSKFHSYLLPYSLTSIELHRMMHEITSGIFFLHHNKIHHGDISLWNVLLDLNGHIYLTGYAISEMSTSSFSEDFHAIITLQNALQNNNIYINNNTSEDLKFSKFTQFITKPIGREREKEIREKVKNNEIQEEEKQHTNTLVPSIVGILKRESSPVLYRVTGLEKWGRSLGKNLHSDLSENNIRVKEKERITSFSSHRDFHNNNNNNNNNNICRENLSKWRITIIVVFFSLILIRIGRERREFLATRLLAAARIQNHHIITTNITSTSNNNNIYYINENVLVAPLTPRPRKPKLVQKRRVHRIATVIV